MRGRNNNNRKGPNPLTRNYESNGPDVKIRGSAQQIAEKYASLARDAQSSGDRVMAENYLQHAEHYNRIILAAQAQMPVQHQRDNRDDFDDENEDEREDAENVSEREAQPDQRQRRHGNDGFGPQPIIDGMPAEVAIRHTASEGASGNGSDQPAEQQLNGHHVNGSDSEQQAVSGEEAPAQRKPRRPRRPRRSESEVSTENGVDTEASAAQQAESGDVAAE
jgi:Domain of unknown function (DUF4167)